MTLIIGWRRFTSSTQMWHSFGYCTYFNAILCTGISIFCFAHKYLAIHAYLIHFYYWEKLEQN